MSIMKEYVHLPEFPVIICTMCKYGVVRDHIEAHFTGESHKKLGKAKRAELVAEIARIDGLISNEAELEQREFPFPPPTSALILALGEPQTNGLRCTFRLDNAECGYICCSLRYMRKHELKAHGWKSERKGGRPRKDGTSTTVDVPWTAGVHCQRFFNHGPKSRYFEVRPVAETRREFRLASRADQFEAKKQALLEAIQKAEKEEDRKIVEPDEAKEPSPWLRRYHAIREVVGLEALFEANKKEFNKETQMPFDSWMDSTTVERYTEVCKQVLCFIFWAEKQEPDQRPPYGLTGRQQIMIESVQASIEKLIRWKADRQSQNEDSEDENEDENRDKNEKDDDIESNEEIEFMKTIQRDILRLWITLLNHPLQDNGYKSVLISAMAIVGIREDGGWLDAEDYTPKYSAVIKMSRLMVIQEACQRQREAIQQRQEHGYSLKEAQHDAQQAGYGYYHLVHKLTHAFMTMAHDGRDPTPMQ
ncbi:hypothetical protein F5884DRAFT_869058 [Xylogone sp. PMI_703]|nr:hypothetical protein F5884DRAFT_869058 [Xylogone sp. PMI_703]